MVNLLWWDIVGLCPHVNLLVVVNTGNDEEHSWSPGATLEEPSQPEDDGSLVLLYWLT